MQIRHHNKALHVVLIAVTALVGVGLIALGIRYQHNVSPSLSEKTTITIHGLSTSAETKPALTVMTTSPFFAVWPDRLEANGNIAAWREASISSEVSGLQLVEVNVDVGDVVHKGQVLAVFSEDTVKAEVAQAKAQVAEAEAALIEAKANADRARKVKTPGVISAQQINDYLVAEQVARAKVNAARAQLENQHIRLRHTRVLAPDDGVISSRTATLGTVMSAGQELFRLILSNRLEWRAEVTSAELSLVRVGQAATISAPGGIQTSGVVRMVGPTVDTRTRMGIVYVDIPHKKGLKAGMFAQGEIVLGQEKVMALPQSAVVQRDGFNYVYRVAVSNKVYQTKVETGRRYKKFVEITGGLTKDTKVVYTGAAFLSDGDTVRIIDASQGSPGSM
jgi:RND family efflux transporter MFP subunit